MSVQFEKTVDIAAPTGAVWRVLADIERWPEWTRSIRSAKLVDVDALSVGARAKLAVAGAGTSTTWIVTAFDAGRSFVWENSQAGVRNVAGHYIEPAGDGCRLRLTIDMSGPLALLMRPYLAYVTRRNLRWESEGLKGRAESGPNS